MEVIELPLCSGLKLIEEKNQISVIVRNKKIIEKCLFFLRSLT
jgi:hypothetical protein